MTRLGAWKLTTLVLIICCVFLAYRVLDAGISLTYSAASAESSSRNIKLLKNLIEHEWKGFSREDIWLRLEKFSASQPPNSIVLEKSSDEAGSIYIESFELKFKDGKLVMVM
jgi:Immunity protein 58